MLMIFSFAKNFILSRMSSELRFFGEDVLIQMYVTVLRVYLAKLFGREWWRHVVAYLMIFPVSMGNRAV